MASPMSRVNSLVSADIGNYLTNVQTWGSILYNVKSYGATGDGVTDDTAAIQAAVNSANTAGGGIVYIPSGTYLITSPIIQYSEITIQGQGIDVTILKPIDCHGISCTPGQYLRFACIKDMTINGNNGGNNGTYSSTKHGINWNSVLESLQCKIERVRVINCYGKGVYVPFDFSNVYDEVYVTLCGGNSIEIAGLNTCTLRNCYVDYVAPGKVGYRIYQNALLISCNGLGGTPSEYWGAFGRNNGLYEDSNNGQSQYNVTFIQCNIEDFTKIGCVFLFSGGFNFTNCTFFAPATGTYEYYIWAQTISRLSIVDGLTTLQSKGATSSFASKMFSNVSNPNVLRYASDLPNFTTDGTAGTLHNIPRVTTVNDSFLQLAIEFDYMNIKGMTYYYHGGKKHNHGIVAPTTGTHAVGDQLHNTAPTLLKNISHWICITAGTPGTWRAFGIGKGTTANRPTLVANDAGYQYRDTTISANGTLIEWTGTIWIDAAGTSV